jgi:hypothetical protein
MGRRSAGTAKTKKKMNEQNLEKLVKDFQSAGQDWVKAKLVADQLEEDKKSYFFALKNALDNGELSEAKLDRLAGGSKEYREYIQRMCLARADMLSKKVRYDAFDKLFDAARSEKAYERAIVEKGIFHKGG